MLRRCAEHAASRCRLSSGQPRQRREIRGIVAKWSPAAGGFALIIDDQGAAALKIGDESDRVVTVSVGRPMLERHWYRVGASLDADRRTIRVFQHPSAL